MPRVEGLPRLIALPLALLAAEREAGHERSALLVLRDCWEATVKFLVVALAADIARASPSGDSQARLVQVLGGLLRKPPAMGDWVGCLAALGDVGAHDASTLGLVPELVQARGRRASTMPAFRHLVRQLWDAVAWRNDTIGHGAVGHDIERLRSEVAQQAVLLSRSLDSMPFLCELHLHSTTPEGTLVSWNGPGSGAVQTSAEPPLLERLYPVWITRREFSAHAGPLLIAADAGNELVLLTFDKVTKWPFYLDYYLGTKVRLPWFKEFDSLYRSVGGREHGGAMIVVGAGEALDSSARAYHGSLERALRDVEFGGDIARWFVRPDALYAAFHASLHRFASGRDAGCWHLVAEAGTGKSWFAASLADVAVFDAAPEVVSYHARIGFRQNPEVFIASLTDQVARATGHDVAACRVRFEEFQEPRLAVAAFLRDVLARSRQGRLLLVVDGLDELFDADPGHRSLVDLLPFADELPAGVILVLTSRPDSELRPQARRYVERLKGAVTVYERFEVTAACSWQRDTLAVYLQRRHGIHDPAVLSRILDASGASFLVASLLGRVYALAPGRAALEGPRALHDLYARYFQIIREHTGAALFDNLHLRLIALLAVSPRPLSLEELSRMLGCHEERLVFAMFDTGGLLAVHRGHENRFSTSHGELATFILQRLKSEVRNRLWDALQISKADDDVQTWLVDVGTYLTGAGHTDLSLFVNQQLEHRLPSSHPRRAEVLANVADMVHITGHYREAAQRLGLLVDHLLQVEHCPPDDPLVIRALLRQAHHLKFIAPIDAARRVLTPLRDALPQHHPAAGELRFMLAGSLGCLDSPGPAELCELAAVAAGCRRADPYLWTRCMRRLADLQLREGRPDEALKTASAAFDVAAKAGSRQEIYLHATIGEVYRYQRSFDQSRAALQSCLSLSQARDLPGWEGHASLALAECLRMEGCVEAAWQSLERAEHCYHEADDMTWGLLHCGVVRFFLTGDAVPLDQALSLASGAGYRADGDYLLWLASGGWTPWGHNRHFLLFP